MKQKSFLLHVGYPKAGSSLLGDWFEKNPALCFADFTIGGIKDTNALIDLSKKADQPQYAVVRDMLFTIPRIEELDLSDISSIKRNQKLVCETLHSFFPKSKVLIVTRGYKSMISANYSQYIKEGGTHKTEDIAKFAFVLKELFDYSFLVQTYCETFGKENVIVLPYELIKEDISSFFAQIETALGLPHYEYTSKVVNPSLNHAEAVQLRRINSMVELLANNTGSFGKKIKERYVNKRRKKAFEWNTETQALVPDYKPPLIEIEDELLVQFQENSALLRAYPVFEKYLSYYGIA